MHKNQFICEVDLQKDQLIFYIPASKGITEEKIKKFANFTTKAEQEYVIVNKLSIDQMKLIWVLCREYGELLGWEKEEMREWLQSEFCHKRVIEDFSISPRKRDAATMEVATEFIQYIVEHAVINGYNLILYEGRGKNKTVRHAREIVPDIRRWVLAHLLNKSCAVCGATTEHKIIELHHWDHVSSIGGYAHDDGLQTRFISLCSEHHKEFHDIEAKAFSKKWHIEGIWLSESIVESLLKIYPGHFKAYRKQKKK